MQEHPEVDVVTVGTGWTAAIIAQQLAEAGLEVVSLERGRSQWTYPDFAHNHDYLRYAQRNAMMQDLSKESWTWRPNTAVPALPFREHGGHQLGQDLGGAGVHWAAESWRFQPEDFRYRSHHIDRYGADKLPEGNAIQDWPVSYDELEPFYDKFEYDVGVSGRAGNIGGQIVPGGNPFEGWRSRPFPLPPLATMSFGELFTEATSELGYHPFPQPAAILSEGYTDASGKPRSGCLYCGYCVTFGCEVDAKASPLTTHLPMALDTGRYEVRTHSTVISIELDDRGMARGLRYIDRAGREHFQPAARVFLSGFTYPNVRLLLLARNRVHPDGVGNNHGLVGKNYTHQVDELAVTGLFNGRRFNPFMGNTAARQVVYEYYADNFDHADLDFIGGGRITDAGGEADPIGIVEEIAWLGGQDEARQWGQQFKDAMPAAYNSTTDLVIHAEDMSFDSKFMDLDPTYTDALGLPLLRITYDWTDNERNMYRYLAAQAEDIMVAMGADEISVVDELPGYMISQGPTHPTGGAIMGTDPSHSVCNKFGQVWDAPNLFVTGAALFPQNPGANPTETICALAYYAADAIKNGYLHRPEELMT